MTRWDVIRFQLVTHCFLKKIPLSESDIDCLAHLGVEGERELTEFCDKMAMQRVFKSAQTVRNAVTKAEKFQLINKYGKNRKKILLNPELNIQTEGPILLDYKFLGVDS